MCVHVCLCACFVLICIVICGLCAYDYACMCNALWGVKYVCERACEYKLCRYGMQVIGQRVNMLHPGPSACLGLREVS